MLVVKSCARRNVTTGIIRIFQRFSSSSTREYKEVRVDVPWGHISGKWWAPYDVRPVISIHGWQDNCGTYDRLIPRLNKDVGFLAIDLPGHGHSSRLPNGMFYSFEHYLISIRYLATSYNWSKVSLLGHSMGGALSFLYGMYFPEEVDYAVCIENFVPTDLRGPAYMAKALGNFHKYNEMAYSPQKQNSAYAIDEIMQKIVKASGNHVYPEYAHHLAERNVTEVVKGKYTFTSDPRTRVQGFPFVNRQDIFEQCSKNVKFPLLVIQGNHNGPFFDTPDYLMQATDIITKTNRHFDCQKVNGTHYVHLNTPENISDIINNFLRKYHDTERRDEDKVEKLM